jgi:DNA-binding transcriptional MerR regulator
MNKQGRSSAIEAGLQHQDLFPIREVSRLTGVNAVTLRAWERRYGLIQPTRTESGHRLYSQADIEQVRNILGWLERGVAVSKVGSILARGQAVAQAVVSPDSRAQWQAQQGAFGQASEWLFLDQFLRGRVFSRLQLCRQPRARHVLLAPLPGLCHELELLVTGLLLGCEDIGVSLLMPGQSLEELPLVCERLRPDALVLFANHAPTVELNKRLRRLAAGLECPLLLAGEASENAQDSLAGSPVACLGAESQLMRRRLQQYLAGQLDT